MTSTIVRSVIKMDIKGVRIWPNSSIWQVVLRLFAEKRQVGGPLEAIQRGGMRLFVRQMGHE